MNCPKCNSEMEDGNNFQSEWAHECKECGCLVCVDCGFVMKSLDEADAIETKTGYDYLCPECERRVYSVDLYPE